MFTPPNPPVKNFVTDRTISRSADKLRTPFLINEQCSRSFLQLRVKLDQFWLFLVSCLRLFLGSLSRVKASCPSSGSNISVQFPRNSRGMNPDLHGNKLLFHSSLIKGFNLIPLYQTELGVIFCHRNAKIALLGQTAKSPKKLLCRLFLKIALIS